MEVRGVVVVLAVAAAAAVTARISLKPSWVVPTSEYLSYSATHAS